MLNADAAIPSNIPLDVIIMQEKNSHLTAYWWGKKYSFNAGAYTAGLVNRMEQTRIKTMDTTVKGVQFENIDKYLIKEITSKFDLSVSYRIHLAPEIPLELGRTAIISPGDAYHTQFENIRTYIDPLRRRIAAIIDHLALAIRVHDHPNREAAYRIVENSRIRVFMQSLAWEASSWHNQDLRDYVDPASKVFREQFEKFIEQLNSDFLSFRKENHINKVTSLVVRAWWETIIRKIQSDGIYIPDFIRSDMKRFIKFSKGYCRYFKNLEKLEASVIDEFKTQGRLATLLASENPSGEKRLPVILGGSGEDLHSEIQILLYFLTKNIPSPYIGVSKLCCLHCYLVMRQTGTAVCGTHGSAFPKWPLVQGLIENESFLERMFGERLYADYCRFGTERVKLPEDGKKGRGITKKEAVLRIFQAIRGLSKEDLKNLKIGDEELWDPEADLLADELDDADVAGGFGAASNMVQEQNKGTKKNPITEGASASASSSGTPSSREVAKDSAMPSSMNITTSTSATQTTEKQLVNSSATLVQIPLEFEEQPILSDGNCWANAVLTGAQRITDLVIPEDLNSIPKLRNEIVKRLRLNQEQYYERVKSYITGIINQAIENDGNIDGVSERFRELLSPIVENARIHRMFDNMFIEQIHLIEAQLGGASSSQAQILERLHEDLIILRQRQAQEDNDWNRFLNGFIYEAGYAAYCENLLESGTWGGDLELLMLADILGVRIETYDDTIDPTRIRFRVKRILNSYNFIRRVDVFNQEARYIVRILHTGGNHYNVLNPLDVLTVVPNGENHTDENSTQMAMPGMGTPVVPGFLNLDSTS